MKNFYALFSCSLLLSQLFVFVPNSLALTNDSPNTVVSSTDLSDETENSWLFTTMDDNVQMIDAIVNSYNKEFNTKLTEYDITQEHLNKLTKLYIYSDNGTGVLPNKFDLMPNLTDIQAVNIGVSDIPTSIGDLSKLKSLNWCSNGIKEIPMYLNKSKTITSLYLESGQIKDIPENLHDSYPSLQVLSLKWNQLVRIPEGFFDYTWGNTSGSIALYLEGNQVTTNVPVTDKYLNKWLYNQGNNLIGNAPTDYYPQDQLINKSSKPIQLRVGDNISKLTPDTSRLGLQSGRKLFSNHQFVYYTDDTNSLIKNNIATSPGNGYIYIKSAFSEISNMYAKVRVPIVVTEENKQSITGSDFTMYVGDKEPTVDSFKASATDKDGNPIDVTTDLSKVDFSKAGTYEVILTATDGQAKTVRLIIKENKQSIIGSDFTMYVGDKEPTVDSFKASATDKDGNPIDVTVDLSKVDFSKAGTYEVILTATDGQTKTVKLFITDKIITPSIDAANKIKYVGDKLTKEEILNWATFNNSDGFVQGFEVVGTPIPVSLENKLTTKGSYKINYYVQKNAQESSPVLAQKEIILTVNEKKSSPMNHKKPLKSITSGTNQIPVSKITTAPTKSNSYSGTTIGKSLPRTGEQSSIIWWLVGVAILFIAKGLFIWSKKTKNS